MLRFLKVNGFPVDLEFHTAVVEDDGDGNHLVTRMQADRVDVGEIMYHANMADRKYWAAGFFEGFKYSQEQARGPETGVN